MPTFTDLSRTSKQEGVFTFTNFNRRLFDPTGLLPPGSYMQNTSFDFTIGGHYGCSARVRELIAYSQPGGPGTPWSWSLSARITCTNGHGASTTGDILLASGGPFAAGSFTTISLGTISGTFYFEVPSDIKYDVNETATAVLDYPLYTTYKQYERSTVGGTAISRITISGNTVQASGTVSTALATDYRYDVNISSFFKTGSVSGVSNLTINAMTTNSIAVPGYTHLNFINSNFYATHTGSSVDCRIIGTDDAFGDPQQSTITMASHIALERRMKFLGKINAYDVSYPDPLTIRITGVDNAGLGYRDIVRTGSYDESDTYYDYSISSTLTAYPGASPQTVNTGPVFTLPNSIKTAIIGSSLTANGDDPKYTRLPFRGWNFPGVFMELANSTQITAGGTSNTRAFTGIGENFNSYRYLEVEVKSNTGTLQSDTLTLTCQPGSDLKTYTFSTSSSTYEIKRFDLLIPKNKSLSIDDQDDPYPRLSPSGSNPAQERTNLDWFGVARISQLAIANANITLGRVWLVADATSCQSDFAFAPEYYVKVETDATAGTTYFGRRLWAQNVSGRHEEDFDVLKVSGVATNNTIANFVSRVIGNHKGWTASASTAPGSGRLSYANSTNGYALWLGGITFKADTGGGTIQKDFLNVYQNQGEADCQVLAQTYFDEFLTSELIPDYGDPFGVYKNTAFPLITLPSVSILRGPAFGLLVDGTKTPLFAGNVDLKLSSTLANRGSGISAINGTYKTGTPMGLSFKNHRVDYLTLTSNITPLYAAKKYRKSFLNPAVVYGVLSADHSDMYQHVIAYQDAGTIKLLLNIAPDFSTYSILTTNITGAVGAAVKWQPYSGFNNLILDVQDSTGTINKYILNNLETGVATLATTLGAGTQPAIAIYKNGVEFHFYRTTDSGGSIRRIAFDPSGNTFIASSLVITGNVSTNGLAAYTRDDVVYLVYSHAVNGITIVRSYDGGNTFS
jgi:hypothetical protein